MPVSKKAFSLIEIIIVIAVLGILATTAFVVLNPTTQRSKANDAKRLSDINNLAKAIEIYRLDTGVYPTTEGITRQSNISINDQRVTDAKFGWIGANLSTYIRVMPIDPINTEEFHYRYINQDEKFEIDAKLELVNQQAIEDGGNNTTRFERGTNLDLLN